MAVTVGAMAKRSVSVQPSAAEEMRDAVAAMPVSPAMLGGARVIRPETGWFASPAVRRAEAEHALLASRMTNVSKSMHARAAKLKREAAADRARRASGQ